MNEIRFDEQPMDAPRHVPRGAVKPLTPKMMEIAHNAKGLWFDKFNAITAADEEEKQRERRAKLAERRKYRTKDGPRFKKDAEAG